MALACTACGSELEAEARFCPNCGRPVVAEQAPGGVQTAAAGASGSTRPAVRLTFSEWILAGATVLLFIALLLPWWSVTAILLGTYSIDGFNSWGWLSFVSWLVILSLTVRLVAGERLSGTPLATLLATPVTQRLIVAAGVAELLGDFLFIAVAPTGSGAGYTAGIGAGVIIAIICGLAIVYGGLLMIGPSWLPKPKFAK